ANRGFAPFSPSPAMSHLLVCRVLDSCPPPPSPLKPRNLIPARFCNYLLFLARPRFSIRANRTQTSLQRKHHIKSPEDFKWILAFSAGTFLSGWKDAFSFFTHVSGSGNNGGASLRDRAQNRKTPEMRKKLILDFCLSVAV
ncbi:MAG: hypothetical protein IJR99_13655, partial [Kiritimatiellae bacterium]|nr:hypothetical protein [Kiritimatiellia bacterium]